MMSHSETVLACLRVHHRGKANAITRDLLRAKLTNYGVDLSDRELRAIYAEIPVCTCEKGIFYPTSREEIEECRAYYKKAALSLLARWRRIADAHPELIDARQKELFHDQV